MEPLVGFSSLSSARISISMFPGSVSDVRVCLSSLSPQFSVMARGLWRHAAKGEISLGLPLPSPNCQAAYILGLQCCPVLHPMGFLNFLCEQQLTLREQDGFAAVHMCVAMVAHFVNSPLRVEACVFPQGREARGRKWEAGGRSPPGADSAATRCSACPGGEQGGRRSDSRGACSFRRTANKFGDEVGRAATRSGRVCTG